MKIRFMAIAGATMLALGMMAFSASAGSVADGDTDGVPDAFDNCSARANGPLAGTCTQADNADSDAFGDACDADFDQDNVVAGSDFGILLAAFGTAGAGEDLDCDGVVAGSDFGILLGDFGSAPGPGAI
jgi:hypothetical protein